MVVSKSWVLGTLLAYSIAQIPGCGTDSQRRGKSGKPIQEDETSNKTPPNKPPNAENPAPGAFAYYLNKPQVQVIAIGKALAVDLSTTKVPAKATVHVPHMTVASFSKGLPPQARSEAQTLAVQFISDHNLSQVGFNLKPWGAQSDEVVGELNALGRFIFAGLNALYPNDVQPPFQGVYHVRLR
jgi:hypothetical protein